MSASLKIVHLIPGTGGSFYCENCIRDGALVKSLRERGHEVTMVPLYLPLVIDEPQLATDTPIFFGAVSVYLKEKLPFLRNMPNWAEKLFNAAPILRYAAGKAGSTRAAGLEDMTLSMLRGTHGNQKVELAQLMKWLKKEIQPDIIYLANALLLGLVMSIKKELKVPVVVALEDEDIWLSDMNPEQLKSIWELINVNAQYVDRFLPVSDYYSQRIREHIHQPDEKFSTTHLGINLDGFEKTEVSGKNQVVGYLSRMCPDMGLDILIDAFLILKANPLHEALKLQITGGRTDDDTDFIQSIRKTLGKAGHLKDVEFFEDFQRDERLDFLKTINILSVPVRKPEAFGVFMIEALAAGVPVVQPATGGFPEIIELTGGGLTYEPNTAEKLAEMLSKLLMDKKLQRKLGDTGYQKVQEYFNGASMAKRLEDIYQDVIKSGPVLVNKRN